MFFAPDPSTALDGAQPYSDTVNPEVIGVLTAFLGLAIITYCLRIWSRLRVYRSVGLDDYVISLALIITIVSWALTTDGLIATGGRHIQYVSSSALLKYAKYGFYSLPLWVWSMTCIKISVSLLFLRIEQARNWKIGIWILVAVQLTVAIATTLFQMLQCRPISDNWSLSGTRDNCWSTTTIRTITYSVSAIFIVTDIICALLPLHFIVQLSRPLREKVVLSSIMALGLLASACGIVKTVVLKKSMQTQDIVYDGSNIIIWSNLEQYIGIIAACMPCLKALLHKAFKALGGQITSMNWGSKETTAAAPNEHALQSYQRPMTYLAGKSGIMDGSAEVLVTTITSPIPQAKDTPITHEYDIESLQIRKEMDVSWSEHKR